MKVILICSECEHHEWGSLDAVLMNKIKMWNHVKHAHPDRAEHILKKYDIVPDYLFAEKYLSE